jgi:hypothetical protein
MARKMKTAHPDKNFSCRKPKGFGGRSVIVEELRCEVVVKVEQTTQAFGFDDRAGSGPGPVIGEGNDVVEPQMVSFVMEVGDVFTERMTQRAFAKEDQLVEAFIFDGAHPAFGEGVEIGRLRRRGFSSKA